MRRLQQAVAALTLIAMGIGLAHNRMTAQEYDVIRYRLDDVTRRVERIEGRIDWVLTACASTLFIQLLSGLSSIRKSGKV